MDSKNYFVVIRIKELVLLPWHFQSSYKDHDGFSKILSGAARKHKNMKQANIQTKNNILTILAFNGSLLTNILKHIYIYDTPKN